MAAIQVALDGEAVSSVKLKQSEFMERNRDA